MAEAVDGGYRPGPWIRYHCDLTHRSRQCQPDGLFFDLEQGRLTLVEVKIRHTPDAWEKARSVYLPCLSQLFPARLWQINFLEVCRSFDPATRCRKQPRLLPPEVANPFGVELPSRSFNVWVLDV